MNRLFAFLFLLFLSFNGFGQSPTVSYQKQRLDSLKKTLLAEAAVNNPLLRQVVISTDIAGSSKIRSYLHGNKLFEGKISQAFTSALVNVPLKKWGRNSISASFSIFQQHFYLSDLTTDHDNIASLNNRSVNKASVGFAATYSHFDSLFGRPVLYSASLSGITSRLNGIQKLSYVGGAYLVLKQTADRRSTLGLLFNFDPAINVPIVPVYAYWRKYKNGLELNVSVPQQLSVRKVLSPKLSATFGAFFGGSVAFFRHTQPNVPQDGSYSTLYVKTGPMIEYRLARKLLVGVNTGLWTPIQAREAEVNQSVGDYFLRNKINSTPFVNFSVSVLPFL